MIGPDGPRGVDSICRSVVPESSTCRPRLDEDILPVFEAVASGRGLPASLRWRREASVCVVLASPGYPGTPRGGLPIEGVEAAAALPGVNVFHAGTALRDGLLLTAGGRV